MKLILFGATGMVGSGALREALADLEVEAVLSIGRSSCGVQHPKLRELLLRDLFEFDPVEDDLVGWDACIWALGISSVGLGERQIRRDHREPDAALGPRAPSPESRVQLLLLFRRRRWRTINVGAGSAASGEWAQGSSVPACRLCAAGVHRAWSGNPHPGSAV